MSSYILQEKRQPSIHITDLVHHNISQSRPHQTVRLFDMSTQQSSDLFSEGKHEGFSKYVKRIRTAMRRTSTIKTFPSPGIQGATEVPASSQNATYVRPLSFPLTIANIAVILTSGQPDSYSSHTCHQCVPQCDRTLQLGSHPRTEGARLVRKVWTSHRARRMEGA